MPHVNIANAIVMNTECLNKAIDAVSGKSKDNLHTPIQQAFDKNIRCSHYGTPTS